VRGGERRGKKYNLVTLGQEGEKKERRGQ